MGDLGEWSDVERGPARNQTGATAFLRAFGGVCIALGVIAGLFQAADQTATPGAWWYPPVAGIGAALPIFVLARVFDHLSFLSTRVQGLTKAAAEEKKAA